MSVVPNLGSYYEIRSRATHRRWRRRRSSRHRRVLFLFRFEPRPGGSTIASRGFADNASRYFTSRPKFLNLKSTFDFSSDFIVDIPQRKASYAAPTPTMSRAQKALPTPRRFVTQLLNSLPTPPVATEASSTASNPLDALPEASKHQLLSLQVLFPHEFLPALDLLDRRLVTRFRIRAPHHHPTNPQHEQTEPHQPMPHTSTSTPSAPATPFPDPSNNTIYYVRSAQQRPSRFSTSYDTTTSYQVRLPAWSCSCPAFAFAAFPAAHSDTADDDYSALQEQDTALDAGEAEWSFGGVSRGDGMPPVCKHLLACVLVERCSGVFGGFVDEREVSVEEAAGWAAGWGD